MSNVHGNRGPGNAGDVGLVVCWKVAHPDVHGVDRRQLQMCICDRSESALRTLASKYPYDISEGEEEDISLSRYLEEVSEPLRADLQSNLFKSVIEVVEARISHLAVAVFRNILWHCYYSRLPPG